LFAILISLISGVLGIIFSFTFGLATGPVIVVISAIIYFITLVLKKV